MKTEKEIEEMAREIYPEILRARFVDLGDIKRLIEIGYSQAQKDLMAEASEGHEEAWIGYRTGEGHSFGHKEALLYGWQSAKLSMMKDFQRMENVWRKKCEDQAHESFKEIEDLKKNNPDHVVATKISILSNENKQLKDKYEESVKDIQWLSGRIRPAAALINEEKYFSILKRYKV